MDKGIVIASDHGGKVLKQKIVDMLQAKGIQTHDLGVPVENHDSVDYPLYAQQLANTLQEGKFTRGILVCGSGIGVSMAANRHRNVRAANVWCEEAARLCRQHNDANVLCLGERLIDHDLALRCVEIWLDTDFEGGRHQRRVNLIDSFTNSN